MNEKTKTVLVLLALFPAFGIVGRMDWEEEQRQQTQAQARAASRDAQGQAMAECLPLPGEIAIVGWEDEGERTRLACRVYGAAPVAPGNDFSNRRVRRAHLQ
jgi:hypothetical protein